MNIDFQDKIDNYLQDRMSIEERRHFEQEVEANDELKEQLEFSRLVQAAFKDRGEKLAKMAQWEQEELAEYSYDDEEQIAPAVAANSWRKYLYWCSGIAAVFIVGFLLFSTMHIDTSDPPIIENADGSVRGNSAIHNHIKGMLATGEYESALALIEKEESEDLQELASLQTNDSGYMDESQGSPNGPVNVEAASGDDYASAEDDNNDQKEIIEADLYELRWLKVQALIGLGDKKQAFLILDALRTQKGYYQVKADSLYHELKKN